MPPRSKKNASNGSAAEVVGEKRKLRSSDSKQETVKKTVTKAKSPSKPKTKAKATGTGRGRGRPKKETAKSTATQPSEEVTESKPTNGSQVETGEPPLKKVKLQSNEKGEVLETGKIMFLYRSKIGIKHPTGLSDIQRFFMLLSPQSFTHKLVVKHEKVKDDPDAYNYIKKEEEDVYKHKQEEDASMSDSTSKPQNHRLLILAAKMLPSDHRARVSAFVDLVSKDIEEIDKALSTQEYDTKTRGHRVLGPCRIVAHGAYEIIQHKNSNAVSLIYELNVPDVMGPVQKEFNVTQKGSFIISVRNPHFSQRDATQRAHENPNSTVPEGSQVGLPDEQKTHFPDELQQKFKGIRVDETRWTPCLPEFLNYRRAELLLILDHKNIEEEFGSLIEELENEVEAEVEGRDEKQTESLIHEELHDEKDPLPMAIETFN